LTVAWTILSVKTIPNGSVKKYSKPDHIILANWAADCAESVLPLFERQLPGDGRPRRAIEVCRAWARTGEFRMAEIRGASLAAHAAARDMKGDAAACFAARAAGQAVATAHVPQHAFGAAYYALKAVAASDPGNTESRMAAEREWQLQRLPGELRQEAIEKILVQAGKGGIKVRIHKGEDF
jgi:hypothetical protein